MHSHKEHGEQSRNLRTRTLEWCSNKN
uniref:Uncharacterized protein n=1 Tax=Rhizophora mucronata TaxID=61149 RepID=A0A2P2R479_RHIMU